LKEHERLWLDPERDNGFYRLTVDCEKYSSLDVFLNRRDGKASLFTGTPMFHVAVTEVAESRETVSALTPESLTSPEYSAPVKKSVPVKVTVESSVKMTSEIFGNALISNYSYLQESGVAHSINSSD
jgi:hypothetical protein